MIDYNAPIKIDDFQLDKKIKRKLHIKIEAAKMRDEMPGSFLFYGQSGVGKSTIAAAIAADMHVDIYTILCSSIKNQSALVDALLNIPDTGGAVFLDELHSLSSKTQEILYPVIEANKINCELDGQIIKTTLPKNIFFIGATTDIQKINTPLRNRFCTTINLQPYNDDYISNIIKDCCDFYDLVINDDNAMKLAKIARGIPRKAKSIVNNARDFSMVLTDGEVNEDIVEEIFDEENMSLSNFLTQKEERYLNLLANDYNGKPVGINIISSSIGESPSMIENIIEPHLLQNNLIVKSSRGRQITDAGFKLMRG